MHGPSTRFVAAIIVILTSGITFAETLLAQNDVVRITQPDDFSCAPRATIDAISAGGQSSFHDDAFYQLVGEAMLALQPTCKVDTLVVRRLVPRGSYGFERFNVNAHLTSLRCSGMRRPVQLLEQIGRPAMDSRYALSTTIFEDDEIRALWAVSNGSSTAPVPDTLVVEHKIDLEVPIGGLTETLDGRASFSDAFSEKMQEILSCNPSIRSTQTKHYVEGFDSEGSIVTADWRISYQSANPSYTVNVMINPGVVSAIERCAYLGRRAGQSPEQIGDRCPGYGVSNESQSNPLADRGFKESNQIFAAGEISMYLARPKSSPEYYVDTYKQVLVMEHNIGSDAPILPTLDAASCQIDPSWVTRLEGIAGFQEFLQRASSTEVEEFSLFHYVEGAEHPQTIGTVGSQQPLRITRIRIDGGANTVSATACVLPRPHRNEKNSVAEVIGEFSVIQNARKARAEIPEVTAEERRRLFKASKEATASRYNYALKTDDFWRAATGVNGRTKLQDIHDGRFGSFDDDMLFRAYFMHYMEVFGNKCTANLRTDHREPEITTHRWTEDRRGNRVSTSAPETRTVRIDRDYYPTFLKYFHIANEPDLEEGLKTFEDVMKLSALAMTDLSGFFAQADVWIRPITVTDRFLGQLNCDDPSLEQIRVNLLRKANDELSIQASGQSYDGSSPVLAALSPKLLFVDSRVNSDAIIVYVYDDTPAGWLPAPPRELLTQTRESYGPLIYNNFGRAAEATATVEVANPAMLSLSAMRIGPLSSYDSGELSLMRAAIDDLGISRAGITYSHPVVVCEYLGAPSLMFWLSPPPAAMSQGSLSATNRDHPLLRIQPPREHCPADQRI